MNRWRTILSLATVALVSAGIWAWHEGLRHADAPLARAEPAAPVQSHLPALDQGATSDSSLAPPTLQPAEPVPAAADGNQSATSAAVDPPSVDTPEPAERQFARGAHAESDQI